MAPLNLRDSSNRQLLEVALKTADVRHSELAIGQAGEAHPIAAAVRRRHFTAVVGDRE